MEYLDYISYQKQMKNADIMKQNRLNFIDIFVCDYVVSVLAKFINDDYKIFLGDEISLTEFTSKTLEYIVPFDITNQALWLLQNTPVERIEAEVYNYWTKLNYKNNNLIDDGLIFLKSFCIPKELYGISPIFMGHELFHGLKETNYAEFKENYTYGEVIPLFFELATLSRENKISLDAMKIRAFIMINQGKCYELAKERYEIDKSNRLVSFMLNKYGVYLNSFYYAIILYNMYRDNPNKIMYFIRKVLFHEITTKDMLFMLGICYDIKGEVFEQEIKRIRRIIK